MNNNWYSNFTHLSDFRDISMFDEKLLREYGICYLKDNWDRILKTYNCLVDEEMEEFIWEVSVKEVEMLEAGEVNDNIREGIWKGMSCSNPEEILTETLEIVMRDRK